MNNLAKDNFIRNKKLLEWSVSVIGNPLFDALLVSAQAHFMASVPSREQAQGAQRFIDVLRSLPDPDAPEMEPLDSGIDHVLAIPERTEPPKRKGRK